MTDAKAHNASALSVSAVRSCQNAMKELQWSCPWRDFILATLCDSPSSNYLPFPSLLFTSVPSYICSVYHSSCDFTAWYSEIPILHAGFLFFFFYAIHQKGGPSSWQPSPSLLYLLPAFPALLSQSCRVNHMVGLRYLFLMSSCDKGRRFP